MFRAAILAGAVALVAAAPAQASWATIRSACAGSFCGWVLEYRAAVGEQNVLTTEVEHVRALILRDAGAMIVGCQPIAGGVRCIDPDGSRPSDLTAYLGDADDQATTDATVHGEAGNDRLTGNGDLSGGPGDDVLTGAGTFHDDDGATPGHDVYSGAKALRYDSRRTPVRVDLRPGRRSEDRVSGVRAIHGGRAADVLIGDDGPNELHGGGGDDVLSGQHVEGGAGDDRVSGRRLLCGPGRDTAEPFSGTIVGGDCEYVRMGDDVPWRVRLHAAPRRPGAPILARVSCHSFDCDRHPDRWRLKAGGRVLGELTPTKRPAALRLNAEGRTLLQSRRTVRVQVERRRRIAGYSLYEYDRFWVRLRRP